ncbi:MAG: hypothetical protein ACKVH1_14955, partial [Alphaproteobacteria bacterium]
IVIIDKEEAFPVDHMSSFFPMVLARREKHAGHRSRRIEHKTGVILAQFNLSRESVTGQVNPGGGRNCRNRQILPGEPAVS